MSEPFVAEIRIFGFNFAPRGWAFCSGQFLPIAQNTALFALIGTTYGGDGRTTFRLPNLEGRAALHPGRGVGLSDRRLGEAGGTETVALSQGQLPSHNHQMQCNSGNASSQSPVGNVLAAELGPGQYYGAAQSLGAMASGAIGSTGGSAAHNNMQPFLSLNFCIALLGIFPQRS